MNRKKIYIIIAATLLLLLVAFLFLSSQKKDQSPPKDPAHIILFTLDTTRADHLGAYGYEEARSPILDSLAEHGVCFSMCIAPAVLTLPAHCALFTGNYPARNGIHINGSGALSASAVTLAELLRDAGYDTAAFIAAFVLDARWGLKQGFAHYDDKIKQTNQRQFDIGKVQRPANEVVDSAINWLEGRRVHAAPLFMWLHLYDPHTPYDPPEAVRRQFPDTLSGSYDGEIAFMDQQIGRFLEFLKQKGLYENSLIIAVGDHGESLGEHGERTHGYFTYQASIHVPLIIRFPNNRFAGMRHNDPVSSVDLLPTITDLLGISPPATLHGMSLMASIGRKGNSRRAVFSESLMPRIQFGWAAINTIVSGNEKYIDTPKAEYFMLHKDPGEKENLYSNRAIEAKRLKQMLKESLREFTQEKLMSESADLDSDTLAKLASLGYTDLGAGQWNQTAADQFRPDPKTKLGVYQQIELAASHIAEEEYDRAVKILDALLKEESEIPQVRLLLASTYLSQNNDQSAKKELDIILKDNPSHIQALIAMANILKTEGNDDRMIALCRKAISLDENNTQAYSLIGESLMNKNQYEEALPHLQRAFDIQPKLTQNHINLAACLIGLQRFDEAHEMLTQLQKEAPHFPSLHYHLALIYHRQQMTDKAQEEYLLEIAHHPSSVPSRFNLAEIYYAQRNLPAYRKEMETIIGIAPELARGYLFLARSFLAGDQHAYLRGIELTRMGLKKAREYKVKMLGYYLLADFYSRQNERDKAASILEKARTLKDKQEKT